MSLRIPFRIKLALMMVMIGAFIGWVLLRHHGSTMDEALGLRFEAKCERVVRLFAEACRGPLAARDYAEVQLRVDQIREDLDVVSASVENMAGEVVAATRPELIGHASPYPERTHTGELWGKDVREVSRAVMAPRPAGGMCYLLFSNQDLRRAVEEAHRGETLLVLMGGLTLCLLAYFVALLISRPIQELVDAAQRMRLGDLTHRAPVHPGDELGEIALTLNVLAEQLEARSVGYAEKVRAATKSREEAKLLATELHRKTRKLQGLARTWQIATSAAPSQAPAPLLDLLREVMDAELAALFRAEAPGRPPVLRAVSGVAWPPALALPPVPALRGLAGLSVGAPPCFALHGVVAPRRHPLLHALDMPPLRTCVGAPLRFGELWVGEVYVINPVARHRFHAGDEDLLLTLGPALALALRRERPAPQE